MARTRRKDGAAAPTPIVVGARYCLRCDRLVLGIALELDQPLSLRSIGTVRSGCCMAGTALVLYAASSAADFAVPRRLNVRGAGPGAADPYTWRAESGAVPPVKAKRAKGAA